MDNRNCRINVVKNKLSAPHSEWSVLDKKSTKQGTVVLYKIADKTLIQVPDTICSESGCESDSHSINMQTSSFLAGRAIGLPNCTAYPLKNADTICVAMVTE